MNPDTTGLLEEQVRSILNTESLSLIFKRRYDKIEKPFPPKGLIILFWLAEEMVPWFRPSRQQSTTRPLAHCSSSAPVGWGGENVTKG